MRGSVGWSNASPSAVLLYVPVELSNASVVEMALPDAGRNGVLLYLYSSSRTDSMYSLLGPPSKSKTENVTRALDGRDTGASICAQL